VQAVGRYNASRIKVDLDLKGVTYSGSVVNSHTLCTVVVSDGKAEIREVFGYVHKQTSGLWSCFDENCGVWLYDFAMIDFSYDATIIF